MHHNNEWLAVLTNCVGEYIAIVGLYVYLVDLLELLCEIDLFAVLLHLHMFVYDVKLFLYYYYISYRI